MGKHADSNNYVTGLDNKDWDVNTTNPVSGLSLQKSIEKD